MKPLDELREKIEARIKFVEDRTNKGEITLVEMATRIDELCRLRSELRKEPFSDEKCSRKKVVWLVSNLEELEKTQIEHLKENTKVGEIWLADYDIESIWGDDWNDAPAHCNSGTPYENTMRNLEKYEIRLGKPLKKIEGAKA